MNHIVLEISSWTKEIPDIVYREILSHVVYFLKILSFHPHCHCENLKLGEFPLSIFWIKKHKDFGWILDGAK